MNNVINDVRTLSTLPDSSMQKLIKFANYSICNAVWESEINNEDEVELDIGIGTLYLIKSDENIQYQFKPSTSLERSVIKTIECKTNPLQKTLEYVLQNKVMGMYKELF